MGQDGMSFEKTHGLSSQKTYGEIRACFQGRIEHVLVGLIKAIRKAVGSLQRAAPFDPDHIVAAKGCRHMGLQFFPNEQNLSIFRAQADPAAIGIGGEPEAEFMAERLEEAAPTDP